MPRDERAERAEQAAFPRMIAEVERCLDAEVDALEHDRRGVLPRRVLDAVKELGLFGASIAVEHGGLGLGLLQTCRVVATIARHDRSLATCVGLHNGLGATPLATLGTDAQKARWLPRLASGEVIAAFAATEVGAGSDLSSIATSFAPAEDSNEEPADDSGEGTAGLRVRGEKQYVTNGAIAGLYTVLARERGRHGGYALLCVPRTADGVEVGAEERKLGLRASSTTSVSFDDAPVAERLGSPGGGLHHAYEALAIGRTVLSAGCIGTAQRALDATLSHVTHRRQFRRTIGEFGASRAHVSAMAARLFAMEALVDHVGSAHERGVHVASPSIAAKVFCSEGAFEITDRALQLHGAMGVLEDTGISLLVRDCRVTRIFEGANDVLLVHLGSELLARGPLEPMHAPRGSDLVERWETARGVYETLRARVRVALGVRAVDRQDCLQALARAHIGLLAASCVIARAHVEPDLADLSARLCLDESLAQLASLHRGEARVELERALTDDLYGRGRHWSWPTSDPSPPEHRAA